MSEELILSNMCWNGVDYINWNDYHKRKKKKKLFENPRNEIGKA